MQVRVSCLSPLRNQRGAAFLLSVYIAALTLLLLGGVSLQRTATEVQSAQLSRDLHQAFFLAEGGLDQALKAGVTEGTGEGTLPNGTYTYTASANQIEVLNPQTMRVSYTITSTGTTNGVGTAADRNATVSGLVVKDAPLQGAFAQRGINSGGCSADIVGSVHSRLGIPSSVVLDGDHYNKVHGDLTIGQPDSSNPYKDLWGLLETHDKRQIQWGENPGILLRNTVGLPPSDDASRKLIRQELVGGTLSAVSIPKIPSLPFSYYQKRTRWGKSPPGKIKSLVVPREETVHIYDGQMEPAHPELTDVSKKGDRKIILRLESLQVWPNAELVFHAPTEIYVEGSVEIVPEIPSGGGFPQGKTVNTAVYAGQDSFLIAVDGNATTVKNGVEIFVTGRESKKESAEPGAVLMTAPMAFYGSVWAPESPVVIAGYPFGVYDPKTDEMTDLGPRLTPEEKAGGYSRGYCYADYCGTDIVAGGRRGTQTRYIVANELFLGGSVAIGKAGNQPPKEEDKKNASGSTLSVWISGTAVPLTEP